MLEKILRAIGESGSISTAELARRTGLSPAMVAQAMRDLAAAGYLAPLELPGGGECASACSDCRLLDACQIRIWQPTEKGRRAIK